MLLLLLLVDVGVSVITVTGRVTGTPAKMHHNNYYTKLLKCIYK